MSKRRSRGAVGNSFLIEDRGEYGQFGLVLHVGAIQKSDITYKLFSEKTTCIKIYTKRMQIEDLKQTPTGSDIPPQGIALGRCQPLKRTLKGCNIYSLHYQMYVTPLQGYLFFVLFLSQGVALGLYI